MSKPLDRLKYHVSDANERGEKSAIKAIVNQDSKYPIGTVYQSRGKYPRTCTVVDILKTYNAAGELIMIRYIATHEFSGQTVTDRDVVETTITMGIEK